MICNEVQLWFSWGNGGGVFFFLNSSTWAELTTLLFFPQIFMHLRNPRCFVRTFSRWILIPIFFKVGLQWKAVLMHILHPLLLFRQDTVNWLQYKRPVDPRQKVSADLYIKLFASHARPLKQKSMLRETRGLMRCMLMGHWKKITQQLFLIFAQKICDIRSLHKVTSHGKTCMTNLHFRPAFIKCYSRILKVKIPFIFSAEENSYNPFKTDQPKSEWWFMLWIFPCLF